MKKTLRTTVTDKEVKRATATRFDLAKASHQAVMVRLGKEQENWNRSQRPIQSARNLIQLDLNSKE